MRILHVLTAFPRSTDDVIVPWLVELLKHLRAAGHEVEVLTSAYKGGGNREFAGIPVHRFRYFPARWEDLTHEEAAPDRMRHSWRYRIMPVFYVACGAWAAWRLGRRQRFDVVHVHWPVPHALFGWLIRRACGARLLSSWYGAELRLVKGSLPWLRPFVRWALETSDQVVAISSHTAREIAAVSDVQPRIIPYTIGFTAAGGAAPRTAPRDGFGVLFVGRLVERKGVRYLIEAVQRLSPDRRARLVIIGDGPERQRLEEQARRSGHEGQVEVRGRVSDRELRQAYADASVLRVARDRGHAGRHGRPGRRLARSDELSGPGGRERPGRDHGHRYARRRRGSSCRRPTPPPWRRRSSGWRGMPRWPTRLGEAGYRVVQERFSWPAILAQWEACYAATLRAPRSLSGAAAEK